MLWCDLNKKLRELHPSLRVNEKTAVAHSKRHPDLTLLGVYFENYHISPLTYDAVVTNHDRFDEKGEITHVGLRSLGQAILDGYKRYALDMAEYWKMQMRADIIKYPITREKIRKIFGVDNLREA